MNTELSGESVRETLGIGGRSSLATRHLAIVGLIVLSALIAGLFFMIGGGDGGTWSYVTAVAERLNLTVTVSATGNLEPTNEVEVSSELSGIIREVFVTHNDHVVVGQVLAELDTDKLEAEVAHARATLAAAKARMTEAGATAEEAKRNFDRQTQLRKKGVVSEQDFDAAKAALERSLAVLESAKADIGVAEANLEVRETDLSKACICSPVEGVVLERNIDPGQTVAASFQAPVLFTIAGDLSRMELQVDVDEADVSLVSTGQKALFTVDAYPNRSFPATITKVRFAPEMTEGVVTYKTHLSVDNSELLLRPGMTATAEIKVRTVEDALVIPNEALRYMPPQREGLQESRGLVRSLLPRHPAQDAVPDVGRLDRGDEREIWILRSGEPVPVRVIVGLSDGRVTEILGGDLKAGAEVIVDAGDSGP